MDVGIIGAGRLGHAMARTALRANRSVVLANSRGPESLTSVVSALGDGVSAGTAAEAASAGLVVLAVPWDNLTAAVHGIDWNGRVVIDATNDWAADDLDGKTSTRRLRSPRCSRKPALLPSTSATSQRAARCTRFTIRSQVSTSSDKPEQEKR